MSMKLADIVLDTGRPYHIPVTADHAAIINPAIPVLQLIQIEGLPSLSQLLHSQSKSKSSFLV